MCVCEYIAAPAAPLCVLALCWCRHIRLIIIINWYLYQSMRCWVQDTSGYLSCAGPSFSLLLVTPLQCHVANAQSPGQLIVSTHLPLYSSKANLFCANNTTLARGCTTIATHLKFCSPFHEEEFMCWLAAWIFKSCWILRIPPTTLNGSVSPNDVIQPPAHLRRNSTCKACWTGCSWHCRAPRGSWCLSNGTSRGWWWRCTQLRWGEGEYTLWVCVEEWESPIRIQEFGETFLDWQSPKTTQVVQNLPASFALTWGCDFSVATANYLKWTLLSV